MPLFQTRSSTNRRARAAVRIEVRCLVCDELFVAQKFLRLQLVRFSAEDDDVLRRLEIRPGLTTTSRTTPPRRSPLPLRCSPCGRSRSGRACDVAFITAPSLRTPKFVNSAGGTFGIGDHPFPFLHAELPPGHCRSCRQPREAAVRDDFVSEQDRGPVTRPAAICPSSSSSCCSADRGSSRTPRACRSAGAGILGGR